MFQSLISQNAEIQKILAFEGAFEKLLNIVATEGGIEGGIVVQDSLTSIDGLLRFNVSNQVCFLAAFNLAKYLVGTFIIQVLLQRNIVVAPSYFSPFLSAPSSSSRTCTTRICLTVLERTEDLQCQFSSRNPWYAHWK